MSSVSMHLTSLQSSESSLLWYDPTRPNVGLPIESKGEMEVSLLFLEVTVFVKRVFECWSITSDDSAVDCSSSHEYGAKELPVCSELP